MAAASSRSPDADHVPLSSPKFTPFYPPPEQPGEGGGWAGQRLRFPFHRTADGGPELSRDPVRQSHSWAGTRPPQHQGLQRGHDPHLGAPSWPAAVANRGAGLGPGRAVGHSAKPLRGFRCWKMSVRPAGLGTPPLFKISGARRSPRGFPQHPHPPGASQPRPGPRDNICSLMASTPPPRSR